MPASQALTVPAHGVRRSTLSFLALLAALSLAIFGGSGVAHAEGKVPEKPQDLVYASEGAEVSPPDMDSITSLMDGLNGAHDEKVGVVITDQDTKAQSLADKTLKEWGLSKNGAVIVITAQDQSVGLAVGTALEDRVSPEDQSDVIGKVSEGIGDYADWGGGVQKGATRLFLYIEDQGLSGGRDDHHEGDDHSHGDDDPSVEEVPAGEAPDDAYVDSEDSSEDGVSDTSKIVLGVALVVVAGGVLFFLVRRGRRMTAATQSKDSGPPSEPSDEGSGKD